MAFDIDGDNGRGHEGRHGGQRAFGKERQADDAAEHSGQWRECRFNHDEVCRNG